MMARRGSQNDHDRLVRMLAAALRVKERGGLKADLPEYPKPDGVSEDGGAVFVPDATGKGKTLELYEVETADSIDDQHTDDEWAAFARYAEQQDAAFTVVVPKGSGKAVGERLAELGIDAGVWEL